MKIVSNFYGLESPWRDWLARSTVNREVGPAQGRTFFLFLISPKVSNPRITLDMKFMGIYAAVRPSGPLWSRSDNCQSIPYR